MRALPKKKTSPQPTKRRYLIELVFVPNENIPREFTDEMDVRGWLESQLENCQAGKLSIQKVKLER